MGSIRGEILWNGGTQTRDILYRTTNGGQNWMFQIPDTSMPYSNLSSIKFINNKIGWAYSFNPTGIHTTNGGDTVWYTGVIKKDNKVPIEFTLKQNYPNLLTLEKLYHTA